MQGSFWEGKCILVTGGTSGLGLELVKLFLSYGCKVIATGRNSVQDNNANENYTFVQVDFTDLKNVAVAAASISGSKRRIDMIINNAGVLSPSEFTQTDNGFEYSFQVNFLSHLLLDELIISERVSAEPLTLVSVASPVYKYIKPSFKAQDKSNYHSFKCYAETKLYLLLIGDYIHDKYPRTNIKSIGFDPGTFSSGIYRMQKKWFHILYKIAAPFMRDPVKVARHLAEILEQENHLEGAIYSRNNRFRNLKLVNNERAVKFMKECSSFIAPYTSQIQ
jgi:NAD(P)-dependent dehydrogenase (short-subunit alcohol dehydrogenase family)